MSFTETDPLIARQEVGSDAQLKAKEPRVWLLHRPLPYYHEPRPSEERGPFGLPSLAAMEGFLSCLLYFLVSLSITLFNKTVLSTYHFRFVTVLLLVQTLVTVGIVLVARAIHVVDYPQLTLRRAWQLMPLSVFNLGRILTSLGSLSHLNVPTNSAILRSGTLVVVVAEWCWFGWIPSTLIFMSVVMQVIGAGLASWYDLHFVAIGCALAMGCNFFAAGYQVQMKADLTSQAGRRENIISLLMYQSLLSLPPLFVWSLVGGDLLHAWRFGPLWTDAGFQLCLFSSSTLAALLNFSNMLACRYTSPLSVTVTSNLKSIAADVLGVFLFPDVTLSVGYVAGVFLSAGGAFWFGLIKTMESKRANTKRAEDSSDRRQSSADTNVEDSSVSGECESTAREKDAMNSQQGG